MGLKAKIITIDGADIRLPSLLLDNEGIEYSVKTVGTPELIKASNGRVAYTWIIDIENVGIACSWTQLYRLLESKGLLLA